MARQARRPGGRGSDPRRGDDRQGRRRGAVAAGRSGGRAGRRSRPDARRRRRVDPHRGRGFAGHARRSGRRRTCACGAGARSSPVHPHRRRRRRRPRPLRRRRAVAKPPAPKAAAASAGDGTGCRAAEGRCRRHRPPDRLAVGAPACLGARRRLEGRCSHRPRRTRHACRRRGRCGIEPCASPDGARCRHRLRRAQRRRSDPGHRPAPAHRDEDAGVQAPHPALRLRRGDRRHRGRGAACAAQLEVGRSARAADAAAAAGARHRAGGARASGGQCAFRRRSRCRHPVRRRAPGRGDADFQRPDGHGGAARRGARPVVDGGRSGTPGRSRSRGARHARRIDRLDHHDQQPRRAGRHRVDTGDQPPRSRHRRRQPHRRAAGDARRRDRRAADDEPVVVVRPPRRRRHRRRPFHPDGARLSRSTRRRCSCHRRPSWTPKPSTSASASSSRPWA